MLALIAEGAFDLVLLDVMMPKCEGYQVLERLEERLRRLMDATLERVIAETVRAVRDFAGACPQSDDITGLALRRLAVV